jgi:UDP-N-acetylmuramate--alanine ligase
MNILDNKNFFFIGVGGAGMSAIAQFLSGTGNIVAGSDRLFTNPENDYIKDQLEAENIQCFVQDASGITEQTQIMVASTAIEDTNVEIKKAKELKIPIVSRAEMLAAICESKKTIAIGGTSGKSTVTAMMFHLLYECGVSPSLITGAGLASLIEKGKIGNAFVGESEYLLIEADESDGSLVRYKPHVGVLLNKDKDHLEEDELDKVFNTFKANSSEYFIVNHNPIAKVAEFTKNSEYDFGTGTRFEGKDFRQKGFSITFKVGEQEVILPTIGEHNMENALACLAVADILKVDLAKAAKALGTYPGIYRRHQLLGEKNGVIVIDDYAHNPAKIAASIKSAQAVGEKVIAWFQPHGFKPTRFIREELVKEVTACMRPQDEMWMSEIYYAGGTTTKNISANDLIEDLKGKGVQSHFVDDRNDLLETMRPHLSEGSVLLLMGARDPSLEKFGKDVFQAL